MRGRRILTLAGLSALALVIALGVRGACFDDPSYVPGTPPPQRVLAPGTLPPEYASVASFCGPPARPAGSRSPEADSLRVLPHASARVPGMRDLWFRTALRCVVRDPVQLAQLWKFSRDSASAPDVPFGEQMLIVATAGERGVSDYSLAIEGTWRRGDTLHVAVGEWGVGNGCASTAEIVTPADAVRVPRAPHVRFHESVRYGEPCRD